MYLLPGRPAHFENGLNSEFISSAFSEDEKAMLLTVTVSADSNPEYNTNPGNATQDKVFLLSIDEANKYFESVDARQCGVGGDSCWWWLRSPGVDRDYAAGVSNDGDIFEYGSTVNSSKHAVRPALWIDLEA